MVAGLFEIVTGSLSPFYSLSLLAYVIFSFFYLISVSLFWHVNKGACACACACAKQELSAGIRCVAWLKSRTRRVWFHFIMRVARVLLSPSSIIWYWPKGGNSLVTGKVTAVMVESHSLSLVYGCLETSITSTRTLLSSMAYLYLFRMHCLWICF